MEYIKKSVQKLSLSTTYNKLHTVLWQQKQLNYKLQKQNTILNTKISSIKQNKLTKNNKLTKELNKINKQDYQKQKQHLKQLYQQIKQQQEWIKNTNNMIEQKNYDKQYKRKVKIQKKLNKTTKKCKQLNKKLHKIQNRLNQQSNQIHQYSKCLGYYEDQQKQKSIHATDVLNQLEKQNQQLNQLYSFKTIQLNNQNKHIQKLNNQVIQLLALKNWMRKLSVQNQKLNKNIQTQTQIHQRPLSGKPFNRLIKPQNFSSTVNNKYVNNSLFKRQPKLKITTY